MIAIDEVAFAEIIKQAVYEGVKKAQNELAIEPERPVGIEELCSRTGLKKGNVYQYTSQKPMREKIPHTKVGKELKFFVSDVVAWMKRHNVKS